ncbi:MAG TPA: AraC family transcriptional regulator [Planctomycetota bacterium]|nr:AraC family transcriptional regulator [Planctomycetota bacterium]
MAMPPRFSDSGVFPAGTVGRLVSCERRGALAKAGVVCLGTAGTVPGFRIVRPLSLDHIVIITVGGSGWLETGGARRALAAGSLALLPAGTTHAYGVDRGSWQLAWIHLDGRRRFSGISAAAEVRAPRSPLATAIAGLADEHAGPRCAEAMAHWSALILVMLRREFAVHALAAPESLTALSSTVATRLHERWPVRRLARTAGCSVDALDALCRRHLGIAPGRHLAQLRLRRAQELLIGGALPVVEIAPLVGYPDPSSFSRAFARWAGCGPLRFRQRFAG